MKVRLFYEETTSFGFDYVVFPTNEKIEDLDFVKECFPIEVVIEKVNVERYLSLGLQLYNFKKKPELLNNLENQNRIIDEMEKLLH